MDQALLARTTGLCRASGKDDKAEELRRHYDSVVLLSTIERARRGDPFEAFGRCRLSGYRDGLPC